eukprot:gnl/Trimastix_PCT/2315.p1 GENE.gnl/Trimastix_PCT/2315~~gnl/Trimastix_PCT/2315.p1  ORF type:complete len:182 (+),score=12.75 gnl/Trimastix_PCT/2315:126-671(+)
MSRRMKSSEIARPREDVLFSSLLCPMNVILQDQLFLGNQAGSGMSLLGDDSKRGIYYNLLKSNGITHVLSCLGEESKVFPEDFLYRCIDATDDPSFDLLDHFSNCCDYIQSALDGGGRVFVHCAAGVSRSASVVIAYLMRAKGWTYGEALRYTAEARPCVDPSNFEEQLWVWEERVLGMPN